MIIPTNVTIFDEGFIDRVTVEFQNIGSSAGALDTYISGTFIIYDTNSIPLEFGFLGDNLIPFSGLVQPFGSGSVEDTLLTDGFGRQILVRLEYDDLAASYSSTVIRRAQPRTMPGLTRLDIHKQRNAYQYELDRLHQEIQTN